MVASYCSVNKSVNLKPLLALHQRRKPYLMWLIKSVLRYITDSSSIYFFLYRAAINF